MAKKKGKEGFTKAEREVVQSIAGTPEGKKVIILMAEKQIEAIKNKKGKLNKDDMKALTVLQKLLDRLEGKGRSSSKN